MYRAIERQPDNPYVVKALSTGLESVRMLNSKTPMAVRETLCNMHNAYHDGTGETWLSLLDIAEEINLQWEEKANAMRLTTRSTSYDTTLEKFVFKERSSQSGPWNNSLNFFKVTNVLNNYLLKYGIKDDVRAWCNARMNFTDRLVNRSNGASLAWCC